MAKFLIITNGKGGVGKTLVSHLVCMLLAKQGKDFRLVEVDNNQDSTKDLNNSELFEGRVESVHVKDSQDALNKALFKQIKDDVTVVVDIGSNDENNNILKRLKALELDNISYLVPIQNSLKQMQNLYSTINLINDDDNIFVIKNQISQESDYIFFEGSKKYGRRSIRKDLNLKNKVFGIPNSELYELAEIGNETLYDVSQLAELLSPKEAQRQFLKDGEKYEDEAKQIEYFNKMNSKYTLAQDSLELINHLEEEFKEILDEC